MPQLDISTFSSQVFWLALFFLAIYFVVSQIFAPKINAIFRERESKILSGTEDAELTRQEIARLDDEYKAAISQARKNASNIISDATSTIKKQVEASCIDLDQTMKHKLNAAEANISKYTKDSEPQVIQIRDVIVNAMVKKFLGINFP